MVNVTQANGGSPATSLLPDITVGFVGATTQYTYASPSGTSNDVNGGFPAFLGNTRLAVTLAAGSATWTGLGAGEDGQHVILWNRDPANSLTLLVASAASVARNRFNGTSPSYVLTAGNACELVYYTGTINAWVIASGATTGGGGGGGGTGTLVSVTVTAASTNNYNPGSGFPTAIGRLDIDPTTNDVTLTGLLAGIDGQQVIIRNVGTGGFAITLAVADAGSAAANQFTGQGDALISQGNQLYAVYYATPTPGWAVG